WGGNYYALPPSRCWFLWDKKQNDQWTTAQAEMAWTNVDRPIRTFRMSQVEAHTEMGHKKHPTQKPVSLMKCCIRMVNADVTTILDPFMGSGQRFEQRKTSASAPLALKSPNGTARSRFAASPNPSCRWRSRNGRPETARQGRPVHCKAGRATEGHPPRGGTGPGGLARPVRRPVPPCPHRRSGSCRQQPRRYRDLAGAMDRGSRKSRPEARQAPGETVRPEAGRQPPPLRRDPEGRRDRGRHDQPRP